MRGAPGGGGRGGLTQAQITLPVECCAVLAFLRSRFLERGRRGCPRRQGHGPGGSRARAGGRGRHRPLEGGPSPPLATRPVAAPPARGAPWRGVSGRADPGSRRRGRGSRLLAVASCGRGSSDPSVSGAGGCALAPGRQDVTGGLEKQVNSGGGAKPLCAVPQGTREEERGGRRSSRVTKPPPPPTPLQWLGASRGSYVASGRPGLDGLGAPGVLLGEGGITSIAGHTRHLPGTPPPQGRRKRGPDLADRPLPTRRELPAVPLADRARGPRHERPSYLCVTSLI